MSLFRNMVRQRSAEEILNDVHELTEIEPTEGATNREVQNGFSVRRDVRDEEKLVPVHRSQTPMFDRSSGYQRQGILQKNDHPDMDIYFFVVLQRFSKIACKSRGKARGFAPADGFDSLFRIAYSAFSSISLKSSWTYLPQGMTQSSRSGWARKSRSGSSSSSILR